MCEKNVSSQGGLGNTEARPTPEIKVQVRARSWCFTLNNYDASDETLLQQVDCKYLVYGREKGESGTPHLQGTIQYKNQKVFNKVKKDIPKAHIEKCIDLQASIKYCKKDGDIFEKGELPTDGGAEGGAKEKMRWAEALEQARTKGECEDPEIQFKHARIVSYHRQQYMSKQVSSYSEGKHLWIWGPPGTGKSRHARSLGDYYLKMINQYWDDYNGEDVVIIDDIDTSHAWMLNNIKTWCDVHSFRANIKYGGGVLRPKLIVVTSNYNIDEVWPMKRDYEAVQRRFNVINMI